MDIFSLFTLCGGLAFFLYGMTVMSNGLEKMAGGKLEQTLKKMTSHPMKGFVLGAGITIAIQSSSAMTVMLVGLVNSGIMELKQVVSIIMGSNVGTTLTAWILSLAGIEGDSFFLRLLKPSSFAPLMALVGILFIMMAKKNSRKDLGAVFVGFAILMYGMELMSDSVSPLADMPEFASILTYFTNPFIGIIVGAVFTGIIQSSAASVGILQALSLTGGITWNMAVPIIMGQNIGTCVTALLSSIGTTKNARRVAAIHVYFNLIGTAACVALLFIGQALFPLNFLDTAIDPSGIALAHSIFNIFSTALLLPFGKMLVKLAKMTIKEDPEKAVKQDVVFLDERLLNTPFSALAKCESSAVEMSKLAHNTLTLAVAALDNYSEVTESIVIENESIIDKYEDKLGAYLVQLSARDLSDTENARVAMLLNSIGDFERISDHAVNILEGAKELRDKGLSFSDKAKDEIKVIVDAVNEISLLAVEAFEHDDLDNAAHVEPLEEVIDDLKEVINAHHVKRLQKGECTIELGFILADLVTNLERVSDHCSNIAARVAKIGSGAFELHNYVHDIKRVDRERYDRMFDDYKAKYQLS